MKRMTRVSRGEFNVYCGFCAAGAALLFPSIKLGLGDKGELGPGFLPFAAALCLLVTGGLLIVWALIRKGKADPSTDPDPIGRKGWLRSGGILLSFTLWPLLVGIVGYLISTFLVSLGITKTVGYRGWGQPILLSVLLTFFLWLIFGVFFDLDLPSRFSL
jgi:hypothetical protein